MPEVGNRGVRIEVDNCGFLGDGRLECWRVAIIQIGNGTHLDWNRQIDAARSVMIGSNCKIVRDSVIIDTDQQKVSGVGLVIRPADIGDQVWTGTRAIVLKGVTIGHDAVVAAGRIVTTDAPARPRVAGVPARMVQRS
jgi:acetyltransferase-like isoleucine patch superfamily enzyme